MAKFGRSYHLEVQTQSGTTLVVEPPFTVEFDITRNVLTSANVASIRIFNLNANHRSQIRKNVNDYGDLRLIKFKAGYGANMPVAFDGNITQAWSVREGTNFITHVESFDGGFAFANSKSNLNFPAGTPQKQVIEAIANDLTSSGVQVGTVGDFPGTLSRSNSYSGSTCEILKEITGGRFFIDNGKAIAISDNECILAPIPVINAASGLLGTPVREQTIINFDMLFEPNLTIGQQIALESGNKEEALLQNFNGIYKIISLKHRGMISDAVCGTAITSVGLLQPLGTQKLTVVP